MKKFLLLTLIIAQSWGLGFSSMPPTGSKTQEYLNEYDAYYIGEGKNLYLTFDAGYENGYTESILNTLKKLSVPATFFLVGNYIETETDLISRMEQEGHIIANHTMHHKDMTTLSKEQFTKELTDLEAIYPNVGKYYRPPKGTFNENNLKWAKELGYKTIFWSLAYVDWNDENQPTHQYAFDKLLPRLHDGAIILLHNTSKTNMEILEEFILKAREQGYEFRSLDELAVG
ncbi:MAG: polysaccharide deacetylase family protein [Defluviitaleaceae bacterium]|nr:polysaccharide deacetylase family protein [Defluviitaleaceae bacterium]